MNKVLVWVSVLLVVLFGGRALVVHMSRTANENTARLRVEDFLRGMKPGGDFQKAFNMWARGDDRAMNDMTQDQYNVEVGRLNEWLAARELGPGVDRYEILKATMVAPAEGSTPAKVALSCSIDGRNVTILAVKDQQLDWVERP